MAVNTICQRCGSWSLCVLRSGERWCIDCTTPIEFTPGPGRRRQAYVQRRILADDRRDDRAASLSAAVEEMPPRTG
jgi:phosphoribosyl 1,2-cyclic phosphodiesterase